MALKELTAEAIVFRDDPAFPKGAQTVVLHGDPTKPGLFILRAKFPPDFVVPPHTHPGSETVLSGAMGSGMGEKADLTKGKMLQAGGVAAVGPFDLIYINPEDDPAEKIKPARSRRTLRRGRAIGTEKGPWRHILHGRDTGGRP